jgi:hypothetical protein
MDGAWYQLGICGYLSYLGGSTVVASSMLNGIIILPVGISSSDYNISVQSCATIVRRVVKSTFTEVDVDLYQLSDVTATMIDLC